MSSQISPLEQTRAVAPRPLPAFGVPSGPPPIPVFTSSLGKGRSRGAPPSWPDPPPCPQPHSTLPPNGGGWPGGVLEAPTVQRPIPVLEAPMQGPNFVPEAPMQVPNFVPEAPMQGPSFVPEAPMQVPNFVPEAPMQGPSFVLEAPMQGPNFVPEAPMQGPNFVLEAPTIQRPILVPEAPAMQGPSPVPAEAEADPAATVAPKEVRMALVNLIAEKGIVAGAYAAAGYHQSLNQADPPTKDDLILRVLDISPNLCDSRLHQGSPNAMALRFLSAKAGPRYDFEKVPTAGTNRKQKQVVKKKCGFPGCEYRGSDHKRHMDGIHVKDPTSAYCCPFEGCSVIQYTSRASEFDLHLESHLLRNSTGKEGDGRFAPLSAYRLNF